MSANILDLAKAEPLNTIKIPGNPSAPTRCRWAFGGVKNKATRKQVRLDTWLLGGRRFTTPEAVDRFFRELNADAVAEHGDNSKEASRRAEAADSALAAMGF